MNPTVAVLRGAGREPRGRRRRGRVRERARGAGGRASSRCCEPGDHVVASRALYGGIDDPAEAPVRASCRVELDLRRSRRPRRLARRGAAETKAFFGETIGNPAGNVLDIEAVAGDRPRARRAADRRQHVRDAVPVPADRVRRRHRRPLGDEVHRRPRHEHRRRRRRLRHASTGRTAASRSSPTRRRPTTGSRSTRRSAIYGYLMKLRAETLRDLGAALQPVQRVPVPAGPRDAVAAHGAPRRERARRRRVPRGARAASTVATPGCRQPATRAARREATCRAARARSSRSTSPAAATAGQRFIRGADAVEPPRERRRREEPRHPPGEHDPPPALATRSSPAPASARARSACRSGLEDPSTT